MDTMRGIMDTINGSLDIRIEGDKIYATISDCDTGTLAAAEMDVEQVKTLRSMLEEALIGVECGPEYVNLEELNQ